MLTIKIINDSKDKSNFIWQSNGRNRILKEVELTGKEIYEALKYSVHALKIKDIQLVAKDSYTTGKHFTEDNSNIYLINLGQIFDPYLRGLYTPVHTTYLELGRNFPITEEMKGKIKFINKNAFNWHLN